MSKIYKIKWTVVESEIYEIEANSYKEACEILDENYDLPDVIQKITMEEVEEKGD